jgi:hypothetical protein
MVAREVLSGTFNGLERLDLCVLNVLSQSPEGALFSLSDEYRPRLRKFLRMKPPLAARSRALLPWNALWTITAEGRRRFAEFVHNPHFEWETVPGVVGIDPHDLAPDPD